jgi:hypothetical protein
MFLFMIAVRLAGENDTVYNHLSEGIFADSLRMAWLKWL